MATVCASTAEDCVRIRSRAGSKLEDEGYLDVDEFECIMQQQMSHFIQAS
jgi:hypothetical protein